MTTFPISLGRGDDVYVLNEAIVPFAAALEAALEFSESSGLPSSIEWLEL